MLQMKDVLNRILMMAYRFEYYKYGFDYDEIYAVLAKHKIFIDKHIAKPLTEKGSYPEWAKELSPMKKFTIGQVAMIMQYIHPYETKYFSQEESVAYQIASDLINEAIISGDLIVIDSTKNSDFLSHNAVREWCISIGRDWPIPLFIPNKANTNIIDTSKDNNQLLDEVKVLSEKVIILEAKNTELANLLQTHTETIKRNIDIVSRLTITEQQLSAVTLEKNKLKNDVLEGKTRSSILKVLGGFAIDAYGTDIHTSRIKGIAELVANLGSVGVVIDADTLSKYLKESAEYVPNPQKI
jgi:hypothetical protein